jgi:cytolysin-activating lysine-acyltransferase
MAHGQLRRWNRGPTLVALATWAWLSEGAENAYLQTGKVPEGGWRSGGRLWFVDVLAPFGEARSVAQDLRRVIPPGEVARSARWNSDGSLRKIGRFAGGGGPT